MPKIRQGIPDYSKLTPLFSGLLLLITLCISLPIFSTTAYNQSSNNKNNIKPQYIKIIFSSDSSFPAKIANKLSTMLLKNSQNIKILKNSSNAIQLKINQKPDLVIAIGLSHIKIANKIYPGIKKLFISTDPGKYTPKINTLKQNAILYMTQPYCRQFLFITLINSQWKSIGYLSSKTRPVSKLSLQQCATRYNMKLYGISTTADNYLTDKVKDALKHADVLLALPDESIYNSETIKNILLTSYRYRKPVIAFSRNFVAAGALASIYSTPDEIYQAAYNLAIKFIQGKHQFKNHINYPKKFNISFNRQVFMALGLEFPDIKKIKTKLINSDLKKARNIK